MKISITALTLLMCFLIVYIFFDNSDRHEWFSVSVLFYYAIGLTFLFIAILTIIGLTIKSFINNQTGKTFLKSVKVSALMLLTTLTVTFIKNNRDFRNWKRESEMTEKLNKEIENQLFKKQLDSLNNVIANSPDNYLAYFNRGLLKRNGGQFESSILDYELALKIKPDDFNTNLEMGYILERLGRKDEAEIFFKLAVNIDTNSYFARKNSHYIDNEKKNGR